MRIVAALAVGAMLLLLVPLLRLTLYAIPWYDDYNYGIYARNFLDMRRSIGNAAAGAAYCTRTSYYAWQGTFSSVFLMSLMPAAWGEQYYFLGPVFLILILVFSVWALTGVLIGAAGGGGRANRIVLQVIITVVVFEMIYTAQQGFYWYNGGVHYVGMHSFLMLLAAAWIKMVTDGRRGTLALLTVWSLAGAVLAGGANYVTALQGFLVGLSVLAFGALLRRKRTLLLIPSLLVYGLCFYKSASAPGNLVRREALSSIKGMSPVMAILHSFKEAVWHLGEFTGPAMLIMLALALPVIWNIVRESPLRFRYPGLLLIWSFCLYAAGFTPTLYTLGHGGFDRTLNAVKITYQILFFVNAVYWAGWGREMLQKAQRNQFFDILWKKLERPGDTGHTGSALKFYLLIGALLLIAFALEKNQAGSYSSYGAFYYIHTGEANEYHREYLARVETIKNGGPEVIVEPYHFRPWFLRIDDLTENADSEQNQAIAAWYEKKAVYCRSEAGK